MEEQAKVLIDEVLSSVKSEYGKAIAAYPHFNSAHEGYAVLLEEVDELWDEVKKKPEECSKVVMYREALHIAAMAVRFVTDIVAVPSAKGE